MTSSPTPLVNRLVMMSDGQRVDMNLVVHYANSSGTITFTYQGGGTTTYSATNPDSVMTQLDQVKLGQGSISVIAVGDATSLTFSGVSPSTATAGARTTYTISGTGFLTSGIVLIRLSDGVTVEDFGVVMSSDTTIVVSDTLPASTYTIYYSVDNVNIVSTGLTITVS
jgi:hypothetical protein